MLQVTLNNYIICFRKVYTVNLQIHVHVVNYNYSNKNDFKNKIVKM